MDTMAFFRTRYDDLHGRFTDDLLSGLTEDQLRHRPHPGVNTIVWLLWHIARAEDIGVNRLLVDGREVLDSFFACCVEEILGNTTDTKATRHDRCSVIQIRNGFPGIPHKGQERFLRFALIVPPARANRSRRGPPLDTPPKAGGYSGRTVLIVSGKTVAVRPE